MAKPAFASNYSPEFRQQMVELVRSGRPPAELAREFGLMRWMIDLWVKQAERNAGREDDSLGTGGLEELERLRRENKRLRMELELLGKAAAMFARQGIQQPDRSSEA